MLADVQVGQAIPHNYKYKYKYKYKYNYKYNYHLCWHTSKWVKQYLSSSSPSSHCGQTQAIHHAIITKIDIQSSSREYGIKE